MSEVTSNVPVLKSPWLSERFGREVQTCGVVDRVAAINSSEDKEWLNRALAWPHNQWTVHLAIGRRLRKLAKISGTAKTEKSIRLAAAPVAPSRGTGKLYNGETVDRGYSAKA